MSNPDDGPWPRQIGRVEITVEDRRALAFRRGDRTGMAKISDVVQFVYANGLNGLDDITRSYQEWCDDVTQHEDDE